MFDQSKRKYKIQEMSDKTKKCTKIIYLNYMHASKYTTEFVKHLVNYNTI